MSISVGTYNVGKPTDEKLNQIARWPDRIVRVFNNITSSKLDIVFLQEISGHDQHWWAAALATAGYAFHYRSVHDKSGVALIYKVDRFVAQNIVKKDFEIEKGRSRSVVQADLYLPGVQKAIRVASFHLYGGKDKTLANKQIKEIRDLAESNDENVGAIILGGDFNSDGDEEHRRGPCRYMDESSQYHYSTVINDASGKKITTNQAGRKIDWIFVGSKVSNNTPALEQFPLNKPLMGEPSDHFIHAIKINEGGTGVPVQKMFKPIKKERDGVVGVICAILECIAACFAACAVGHSHHNHHHRDHHHKIRPSRRKHLEYQYGTDFRSHHGSHHKKHRHHSHVSFNVSF